MRSRFNRHERVPNYAMTVKASVYPTTPANPGTVARGLNSRPCRDLGAGGAGNFGTIRGRATSRPARAKHDPGDLARLAGVSANATSQAESDHRGLSLDTLLTVLEALGIGVDTLISNEPKTEYVVARRDRPGPYAVLIPS